MDKFTNTTYVNLVLNKFQGTLILFFVSDQISSHVESWFQKTLWTLQLTANSRVQVEVPCSLFGAPKPWLFIDHDLCDLILDWLNIYRRLTRYCSKILVKSSTPYWMAFVLMPIFSHNMHAALTARLFALGMVKPRTLCRWKNNLNTSSFFGSLDSVNWSKEKTLRRGISQLLRISMLTGR